MEFTPVTPDDLNEINKLQPEGWTDIVPKFRYYIDSGFSYPVKVSINGEIIGTGVSISFQHTSWLANIIVDSRFRKQGIGGEIVGHLLNNLDRAAKASVLLIATQLGETVYLKAGFRTVTEYIFFKREDSKNDHPLSENIVSFEKKHRHAILEMDKRVSGENRERLIYGFLDNSKVFIENNKVLGFYLPDLGEGLIEAENKNVGIELMKFKYDGIHKAVLPIENTPGIDFLKEDGFTETSRGKRMILGLYIPWQPEKLYSRIGGDLG